MVDLSPRDQEGPDDGGAPSHECYEPPRVTRLGTIAELTLGQSRSQRTDGVFPGSQFT
jgi:hypothetical protein